MCEGKAISGTWQVGYKVKGLVAEEKDFAFRDWLLVRGIPPSDNAEVLMQVTAENDDVMRERSHSILKSITQIYSLVSDRYIEILPGTAYAEVSSDRPFGFLKYFGGLTMMPVYNEDQRAEHASFLRKALEKYDSVKSIFQDRKKSYLRNAIDYYTRSLGDSRLEEKLIDGMISLESLFSSDVQELRLRISLRSSFFLSVGRENELPKIFGKVYSLYGKRNKVVHGIEGVALDCSEISEFQGYVRRAIRRFIHIDMPKKRILMLTDRSVYDEEKRDELVRIISEAGRRW